MSNSGAQSTTCPACNKPLRWRAEFVGKKMKCTCGQVFTMPEAPGVAGAAAGPTAAANPAPPPSTPVAFDSDFELDQPSAPAAGEKKCPSCGSTMKPGAVLCVNCGFNTATGGKVSPGTKAAAGAAGLAAGAPKRGGLADLADRSARKRLGQDEVPTHRFTELYLPLALIIIGVAITVVRAYAGMGRLTAIEEEVVTPKPRGGPFIWNPGAGSDDDMFEDDLDPPDGQDDDEPPVKDATKDEAKDVEKDADKNATKDTAKDATKDAPAKDGAKPPPDPIEPDKAKDDKDKAAPPKDGKDAGPKPAVDPEDEDEDDGGEDESGSSTGGKVRKPVPAPKSFSVSPLLVAAFSLGFQLIVMLPIVFVCVLFVAKYVDVTFGSLGSVLFKLTALVLGPMAVADWIDDMLFAATLGMGAMLGWTIRIVLVGASVIKLFDLDFFEAAMLLIVIMMARFILFWLLMFLIARMFLG